MKNSMWVIIIIVVAILGFLVGYSLAPTDVGGGAVQGIASGGYGGGAATGGYGGGAATGGYGGGAATGGYGGH